MEAGGLGSWSLIYLSGRTEGNTLAMSPDTSQANVEDTEDNLVVFNVLNAIGYEYVSGKLLVYKTQPFPA